MKNLKKGISVITLAFVLLVSFNVNAQKTEYSKEQIEDLKSQLRQGMNAFVENVKPFYKEGMTYSEFKTSTVGKGYKNITEEGDALLNKAYNYLSNSTSSKKIIADDSTIELVKVLNYLYKSNTETNPSDRELILFGSTTGETFPLVNIANNKKDYPCKWYQIRCHLVELFGEDTADDVLDAASCVLIILFGGTC